MALLDSWTGKTYRHMSSGLEGVLVKVSHGPRGGTYSIRYELRGETLFEPVTMTKLLSDWTDELGPSQKLRAEEIQKIADIADRTLQACVRHEPYLFHEMPLEKEHVVFDREFHQQIRDFLRGKYNGE